MHLTSAIALAILSATAEAAKGENTFAVLHFRGNSLTSGRMDPIVNPGTPSGHVHVIQGGNAFAMDMDDDTPSQSTCTSATINKDFSNYWTPSLYFQDPKTGELESVPMFYQNVYYFFEAAKEEVHPFPKGLRMFVGDPGARSPPSTPASSLDNDRGVIQPVQWVCPRTNPNGPLYPANSNGRSGVGIQDPRNGGAGVGFPDQECDGYASPLRADIHFPSCYDPSKGVRSYKDNMQWPTSGVCPQGTIHVPHLFFEVYWDTLKFKDRWTKGQGQSPWVLSNGDPTGYSLHADFINGWEEQTLQAIIDTCNAGNRGMEQCPNIPGGVTRDGSCTIQNQVPETIFGKMSKLPGGNAIGEWGVNGSGGGGGGGQAAPAPPRPSASRSVAAVAPTNPPAAPPAAPAPAPSQPAPAPAPAQPSKPATPVAPVKLPAAEEPKAPISAPPAAPPAPTKGAGSATLVTEYVSETTIVYTTVTRPAGSAPSAQAASPVADGWSYKGCFSDIVESRVLSGITFANVGHQQVTNTKCVDYCEARGFSIAGTEFGGQCFCGNALEGSESIGEDRCAMPCEGDDSQTCGGGLALSVYEKAAPKKSRSIRRSAHIHRHAERHLN